LGASQRLSSGGLVFGYALHVDLYTLFYGDFTETLEKQKSSLVDFEYFFDGFDRESFGSPPVENFPGEERSFTHLLIFFQHYQVDIGDNHGHDDFYRIGQLLPSHSYSSIPKGKNLIFP
jgi:hypothetical protein